MNDVRRLERRAARGDAEAQARLVSRQPAERLALAARLGDEASVRALGWPAWCLRCWLPHEVEAGGRCKSKFFDWVAELSRFFSHEVAMRVAVAGVQPAQDAWEIAEARRCGVSIEGRKANGDVVAIPVTHVKAEILSRYGIDPRPRLVMEAIRLWLEESDVERAGASLRGLSDARTSSGGPGWDSFLLAMGLESLSAHESSAGDAQSGAADVFLQDCLRGAFRLASRHLGRGGQRKVREAVRREVLPWALGRA